MTIITRSGTGTTIIEHNQKDGGQTSAPGRFGGCSEPGCHQVEYEYGPEIVQIEALIGMSAHWIRFLRASH